MLLRVVADSSRLPLMGFSKCVRLPLVLFATIFIITELPTVARSLLSEFPPFGVRVARIVAPLSASAARDRHPPRSCTFVENSETRGESTTSGHLSSRLSGTGLPFLPYRRAVLAVSHDLDRFAAHGLLNPRPPGLRTEPWSTASPQLASVPVGLPRATSATEVVLANVDLTNLALQAYCILQPIMGFTVFPDGGSASPLTRAALLPLLVLSHGAQSLRSLRSLGWCAHPLSRPRNHSP